MHRALYISRMDAKAREFRDLVAEQLDSLPNLRLKAMFGGFGLYADEVFFAIIHSEKLYFRTNEETRKRYEAAGMKVFTTPGHKTALRKYYEVPMAVIERRRELTIWAREALKASA